MWEWRYCNVDDEALLGNDPVTQQWKGSDRCYAMAQYTGANNGVEDIFCGQCGGYITSNNSTEMQCSMSHHEDSFQLEFEVVNAVTVNVSHGKKHASEIANWD
jgi:hypothetical protein